MTLRYEDGKPAGLDWSVCHDGTERPEVWTNWAANVARAADNENREDHAARRDRPAPQRLSPAVERQVIRLYRDELMSAKAVGQAVGIQPATVFKVLKRNGVASRTKSEGRRLSPSVARHTETRAPNGQFL